MSGNEVSVGSQSSKVKAGLWSEHAGVPDFRGSHAPVMGQTQVCPVEGAAEGGTASRETVGCEVGGCCPALKSSKETMKRGRERVGNNWIVGASQEATLTLAPVPGTRLSSKGYHGYREVSAAKYE